MKKIDYIRTRKLFNEITSKISLENKEPTDSRVLDYDESDLQI